jgi:hypothetical protein
MYTIFLIVQERLSKASDCEQLKHCGDLIEQLKFLVEEPRGQRFVVNINVPSQVIYYQYYHYLDQLLFTF